MKKATFLITAIGSALLLSCTANTFEEIQKPVDTVTTTNTTGKLTYTTDVKPIIDNNCLGCHNTGQKSPTLVTATQVTNATKNGNVLGAIQGTSGPIMPSTGKMSADKIKTIVDWASQGYAQ